MEEMEKKEPMAMEANMAETPADNPAGAPAPAPEAPKKGGKKWGLIIGAAAVVAVIAAAFGMMRPKTDPKTAVVEAFRSITSAAEVSPMEEIFGGKDFNKKIRTSPYQVEMELQLDGSSDSSLAAMASGKIFMNTKSVPETREQSAVLGIGYGGMDLARLQAYVDETRFVMSFPELSSKAFTINYKDDLKGQMERSPFVGPLLKEAGMEEFDGFGEYMQYLMDASYGEEPVFDLKGLWTRYKEGSKAVENLKAAMTVEKIESKKQTINGKEESVDGYQVLVTKDALKAFMETSREFFANDEAFKTDFIEYIDQISNIYTMYGVEFDGQDFPGGEELWAMVTDGSDENLAKFYECLGDVSSVVYVRKDGKMASYEAKTPLTMTDDTTGESTVLNLTVSGTYEGGYSLKANSGTSIQLESEEETVSISFNRTGTYDKAAYNDLLEFRVTADGLDAGLKIGGTYTAADGSYTMNIAASNDSADVVTVDFEGVVSNLVKGESFDISFDSVKVAEHVTGENITTELSGRYAIMPLEGGTDMPEGEPMDMLAATEEDWNNVGTEMLTGLFGLMGQLQ